MYRMHTPSYHYSSLTLFFCLLICLLASGCNHNTGFHSFSGLIWNTSYHIMYKGPAELEDSIQSTLDEVGKALSVFDPNSLVSMINNNETQLVNDHFKTVYSISADINKLSNGMFDPTVSPLVDAWGFGRGHAATADTLHIDSLLNICGLNKTFIRNDSIFKERPEIKFNFSAVAKGYGCDAVARMFKRNGVKDYLVEIGGEIAAGGLSPRGSKWRIGIESPENYLGPDSLSTLHQKKRLFSEFVNISNECVATSSNLRNRHRTGSGRNGHIISPVSGLPIESDVISATVFSPDCAKADALATAAIALGMENSIKMMRNARVKAILISNDTIIRINWE